MQQFFGNDAWIGVLVAAVTLWSLPWKGIALWRAARESDKKWFIALLIINTAGILDILYIYVFSKRRWHRAEDAKTLPTVQEREKNSIDAPRV